MTTGGGDAPAYVEVIRITSPDPPFQAAVVPANFIPAQTGAASGELAEACAANNGEIPMNALRFGPPIA